MSKFILIGNGFVAPRHIEGIKHVGGELVAVCDIDESKRIEGIPFFTDYKEALKQEADWVAICTPNYLHHPITLAAIAAGKKVLCEKPIVINSKHIYDLPKEKVFNVLQLRNHPAVLEAKKNLKLRDGELVVKVKRDQSYWDGWKGDRKKSGGILFNLGVHYFDLLFFLYGNNCQVIESEYRDREAYGILDFNGYKIKYEFQIMSTNEGQCRKLIVGNEVLALSDKDNLAFEGLHNKVYEDLMDGKGVEPLEAGRAIQLIEFLI